MAKKLEELDLNLGNELSAKDQEIQAQKTLQQRIENELESAKESAALQKQILDELQKLKESPLKGIDMMDNEALREERDRLLDENAQMRVKGGNTSNIQADGQDGGGASSTVRYLRSKVSFQIKTWDLT